MWCQRFRPQDLDELTLHPQAQNILHCLAENKNIPHILFVGQTGCGRHTRAMCLLKRIFNVQHINSITSTVTYTHGQTDSELVVISSPVHLELNPSLAGTQDAAVITSVIKEAATTRSVNSAFKVLFIQQADRLSVLAQQALRRLMEEHARTCKLFLFCESASGLMAPVRSRCFVVRLPQIDPQDLGNVLQQVTNKVGVKFTSTETTELVEKANGNLRRLLLLAQALNAVKEASGRAQEVLPKWEVLAAETFAKYYQRQEPLDAEMRKQIVEIMKLGVPADMLLRWFYYKITMLPGLTCQFLLFVAQNATEYDARLRGAQVGLIHLEAFLIAVLHARSLLTK